MTELDYRSKADLVTEHLRRAIQAGQFRPGQRLVVDRVAADFGVSKVPVREAVTRLTGEGLLELRPNIGPVVPSFTADDVTETALLRVAVDAVALELALPLHDQRSVAESRGWLEKMANAQEGFPELNVRFHTSLVAPCPYGYIRQTVESLLRRAQRFSPVTRLPGYQPEAHKEHTAIFEAMEAKDLPLLLRLNEVHIRGAADQLVSRLERPLPD